MDKEPSHASEDLRVIDDLSADLPVSAAELDAVEAFLMPLVNELFSGPVDSEAPQRSAR